MILWTRLFLEAQGVEVTDNVIYQDNQSTMLLAKNGRQSSGKNTRHLEVRYYFVTDNVGRKRVSIEYCPTQDMVADFFTKPLQGALFFKLRKIIMGLPDDVSLPNSKSDIVMDVSLINAQECVGPSTGIEQVTTIGSTGIEPVTDGNTGIEPVSDESRVHAAAQGSAYDQRTSYANVVKRTRLTRAIQIK